MSLLFDWLWSQQGGMCMPSHISGAFKDSAEILVVTYYKWIEQLEGMSNAYNVSDMWMAVPKIEKPFCGG